MATEISSMTENQYEDFRTSTRIGALKQSVIDNLLYYQARLPDAATPIDWYLAVSYTVRDHLLERWLYSERTYKTEQNRTVCYFSAEFLPGPHLGNNLINMGFRENLEQALSELGHDLENILMQEVEPGLGSGGLGRLASCFLDSLSTCEIPAIGYGIRYEFGIFNQEFVDGWQVEKTDKWLIDGNPWELLRHKISIPIKLGGYTEHYQDINGRYRVRWIPEREVRGVAYDTPIVGYGVDNANLLRLWKAEAPEAFDLDAFNTGDHFGAVSHKIVAENLTKILYPNDHFDNGKRLRLEQQYFLVSCSLQDMIRIYLDTNADLSKFHEKYAAQLNDTHPALAIPELMRLLIDEYNFNWEEAWHVTSNTFSYTNHTLLPEAIETWSTTMLEKILPRHLEIIYEINQRFLDQVRVRYRGNIEQIKDLSIIGEDGEHFIRMANLACVGAKHINGVAKLHTELLKEGMLKSFNAFWPEKILNVTNGVTPRRFIRLANPALSDLISDTIGTSWERNLNDLHLLEKFAQDAAFQQKWHEVNLNAKKKLSDMILERNALSVDPESLFSVQVKRIHEYKRQLLNLLHILTLYNRLKDNPGMHMQPRTFIFSGKAAPAYTKAKLIIKLINEVALAINSDPEVNGFLKIFFLPNYSVKNAQILTPAADLSEQISTAGKEASGTGNMKLSMNGALTIGTLDGANIEIRDAVGHENFFLVGHTAAELGEMRTKGYHPYEYYQNDHELKEAIDLIDSGVFSHGDGNFYKSITNELLNTDEFMLLADYRSYVDTQQTVVDTFQDKQSWTKLSILNVARMGYFSSDRAIREYAEKIWEVSPVEVRLNRN